MRSLSLSSNGVVVEFRVLNLMADLLVLVGVMRCDDRVMAMAEKFPQVKFRGIDLGAFPYLHLYQYPIPSSPHFTTPVLPTYLLPSIVPSSPVTSRHPFCFRRWISICATSPVHDIEARFFDFRHQSRHSFIHSTCARFVTSAHSTSHLCLSPYSIFLPLPSFCSFLAPLGLFYHLPLLE